MDIHKYKFITMVNDIETSLSLRGLRRMGQFVTEKGVFPPLTRWPSYRRGERSLNAREHVRGISQTCRYPYWFRGCVAADLFHWLFLSSIFRGALLSRGLKIKKNDNSLSSASSRYTLITRDLLMPLFYWLPYESRENRGEGWKLGRYAAQRFGYLKLYATKLERRRTKNDDHV